MFSTQAAALTAEDVIVRMTAEQRSSYISGSVEMAAFLAHIGGDRERARCIVALFYDNDDPLLFDSYLAEHQDRQAMPVLYTVIRNECGE